MRVLMSIFIFAFSPSPVFAIVTGATVIDQSCKQDPTDPNDLGWRIDAKSKSYAGKCMDSSSHRPVKILENSSQQITFTNFYHDHQFWTARYFNRDISSVQFEFVHFNVDVPLVGQLIHAAHAELRFHFTHGLDLIDPLTQKTAVVNDVIVDWEAAPPIGVGFDPVTGFIANEPIVGRVTSLQSRVTENLISPGVLRKVEQYRLNLNAMQVALLFQISIKKSNDVGVTEFYTTVWNNCTTKPFTILDEVLAITEPALLFGVKPFKTALATDPIVEPARKALVARRLISQNQISKTLADELYLKQE